MAQVHYEHYRRGWSSTLASPLAGSRTLPPPLPRSTVPPATPLGRPTSAVSSQQDHRVAYHTQPRPAAPPIKPLAPQHQRQFSPMYAPAPRSATLHAPHESPYGHHTPPPPQPRLLPHEQHHSAAGRPTHAPVYSHTRQPSGGGHPQQASYPNDGYGDARRAGGYEHQQQIVARQQYHQQQQQQQHYQASPRPAVAQPQGRYQPSKGAQRDAKWTQRHQAAQMYAQHTAGYQAPHHGYAAPHHHGYAQQPPPPVAQPAHASYTQYDHRAPNAAISKAIPSTIDLIAEQQAAIAQARKNMEETKAAAKREEESRKVRRIQLQVFVHARPTHCSWGSCHAVLNSWALLEKHLYHAHLHSSIPCATTPDGRVVCGWKGCTEVFKNREEVYKHCLVIHMKSFSARCPFNCLYEGPAFADLMAHIGRRHPTATPDDFVPGLIHHKPQVIPNADDLPTLPSSAVIPIPEPSSPSSSGSMSRSSSRLPSISKAAGMWDECTPRVRPCLSITSRTKAKVVRKCLSGRRPRKAGYEDKVAAREAIKAVIENGRRVSVAALVNPVATIMSTPTSPRLALIREEVDLAEGGMKAAVRARSAERAERQADKPSSPSVELLNLKQKAKEGKEAAKRELKESGVVNAPDTNSECSSRASSVPPDETDGASGTMLRLRVQKRKRTGTSTSSGPLPGQERDASTSKEAEADANLVSESESDSESDDDAHSDYKAPKGASGLFPQVNKRLRRTLREGTATSVVSSV